MNVREQHINHITRILATLKAEVQLRNSINLYDFNIHAENFYRDLFNHIYDFRLENLNAQTTNNAYIDLVDVKNKKAIQVTSQNDNGKIREAIEGFFSNSENTGFELNVLLISKAAKDYRTDFTSNGNYKFDHTKDVIDVERLIADINDKETPKIQQISEFLSREVSLPRLKVETNEVETIMRLIEFLSRDENLNDISDKPNEVDPKLKFHRFEEHADFIKSEYEENYAIYFGTLDIAKRTVGLDGIRARKISSYLKVKSDSILNKCDNNPRNAIETLADFFEGRLSENGIRCDSPAIRFYLLEELISCNVFPNPVTDKNVNI